MKVSDLLNNPAGLKDLPIKDGIKNRTDHGVDFGNHLSIACDMSDTQHLQRLVETITKQGQSLAAHIDIRELRIYKKLIAEFIEAAVWSSKKYSKKSLLDRRGRRKVFAIIKSINDELELLTQDVLSGEKDNISLLQRLDDIRGLILDLFT